MKRKDMEDLTKDIADTANTAKEIVQDIYCDAKAGAKKAADMVDEFGKSVAAKTENVAADIKKGAQDVGRDVKQTADHVSRSVTASKRPHRTEKKDQKPS